MNWWLSPEKALCPKKGNSMTSSLRTGPNKRYGVPSPWKRYGVTSPWALQGSLLGAPSGTLRGLDSQVQTAQSAIIGLPVSYRTYRRDTPPSIDRDTRPSEGDRGGRTELVHSWVFSFFPRFDESRPSQRDEMFPPSRSDLRSTRNLNLVVSSPQARNRYGI